MKRRKCCKSSTTITEYAIYFVLIVFWLHNGFIKTMALKPTSEQIAPVNDDIFNFECFGKNEKGVNNSIFVGEPKTPIHIHVSNRVTHQLLSRIFAIFLHEILGYKNISLIKLELHEFEKFGEKYKFYTILSSLTPQSPTSNIFPIDVEVWMHYGSGSWPIQLVELGLVTNHGRFGWFVPSKLMTDSQYNNTSLDFSNILHYKIFQLPDSEMYKKFIINNDILEELKATFGVQEEYIPEICNNRQCVTLLSEFVEDTGFIKYHINELQTYTNVLWIGEKFQFAVEWIFKRYTKDSLLRSQNRKYVIVHWTPSNIIDTEIQYDMIIMPRCEEMKSTSSHTLCKYDLTPLLKYYGTNTRTKTPESTALENFYLPKQELKRLLIETNAAIKMNSNSNIHTSVESIYNQIACKWVKNNELEYLNWIDNKEKNIYIGGIFPKTGTNKAYKDIVAAAEMAVKAINANKTILSNYKLFLVEHDGQCKSDVVMKTFIAYYKTPTPLIGILGPACSETVEPIAGISKHAKIVVISYSAEGASFLDREAYPYFFRTIGSNRQYEAVYLNLFQQLNWKRFAALTEDGQKYTEYISHMEALVKQNDIEMIVNKKFPKDITTSEMRRYLLDLKKKNAHIIIADIYNHNVQMVMCEAYKLEMTAYHGYVWFLPVWLSKNWTDIVNYDRKKNISCTSKQFYEAINGHFSLTHASFASNSSIMQENRTVQQWLSDYSNTSSSPSDYAGFAYDAVWVYAKAADQLLRKDSTAINKLHEPEIVNQFVNIIWKTDFNGVSGRVRFGEGGSRINDINILQWINGKFHQIGKYIPQIREDGMKIIGGKLELNESAIVWMYKDGKPKDGTFVCQLAALAEFFNTDCDNVTLILTTFLCLLFVILVSLASFMFWKRQYDRKLKESAKVMRNFGIDLLSPSSNINTLDKWEIPKEKVVINRRLGEGAFGTVYGGEAQFTEKGWTAVAVKTLKTGATTEDRLDFLSEAEAMKRFDHENIVKLLGVCLQTEPIYTIMEFMLYGDLKTFLLARRHLVNEKIGDDSDISSKRLTMMALDVARGLSYLAEQKYVHRDIACRNCLVNARRVVKIGDFGMARPMFENDYYRFNRKGMLPVRWMSPESLVLGMFTPSSDVWSFGVLLYEIVTFGSFPYQGLTNNQVLEHIKSGKTLDVPHGSKPHLEGLMRACWNQDPKKRPSGSEIVEYITNYPRLLTPCIDVPITSVQMPETDSDQMELLPRLRRRIPTQPNLDILSKATNINNFDQKSITPDQIDVVQTQLGPLNVPLERTSSENDDSNINTTTTYYSPMEPLLRYNNSEISNSNLSLKRYVPMCVITPKKCSLINAPNELENNSNRSNHNNNSNSNLNSNQINATSL